MTTDPIDAIRGYAPLTDDVLQAEIDAVFDRVHAELDLPAATPLSLRARHRRVTAVGAAAAITLAGVGVAAAAGVPLPDDVRQTFSSFYDRAPDGSRGAPLADPATAERVFSIPGPDGTRFEGWTATNANGGLCVTTTFEQPGNAAAPADITTGGGMCADAHAPHGLFQEGSAASFVENAPDRTDFVWEAGDAVRAELHVSTGKVYPVAIQDGWLGGYFGIDQIPLGASATIVAYGADGSVLDRHTVLDQSGCPDPSTPC